MEETKLKKNKRLSEQCENMKLNNMGAIGD